MRGDFLVGLLEKLSAKAKAFVKSLKWQDYAFIALLAIYLVLQINLLSSFKQLPSPIYGGDYYFSLGSVQHMMSGGNPFVSSNVLGSEPAYLPLYTILVSVVGWIFGLSAFAAMKCFAMIELVLALTLFYLFSNRLFKNKSVALISVMLYLPLMSFPVLKYLQFTITFTLPAYLFAMLYFYEKRNLLSAIIAGIIFGLLGISHSVGFVTGVFFFIIFSIYLLFFEHLKKKEKKWFFDQEAFKHGFLKTLVFFFVIGLIGSAIAMLYWFKPIFVYHGVIQQPYLFTQDLSLFSAQLKFVWDSLKGAFFNFSTLFDVFKSIFLIIGVLSIFLLKKYDASKKFLIIFLITAFVGSFHFLLSEPLLKTNLSPVYMVVFCFGLLTALFAALGVEVITSFAKKYKPYVLIGLMLLLLILNMQQFVSYAKNDKWIAAGRQPLSPNLVEMQKWVLVNTKVNDVFLSTNELNFALNGLTGRKEVNGRTSHNSMFLDVGKRYAVAAVMLYGNDSEERKKLLREYSVDYLYWDYYWIQSEYVFDDTGKLTSWYDPLIVEDTPVYNELMKKYNVSFFKQHTWPDPAVKGDYIKQLDLIFILPSQFNITHPWNPGLDKYLEEAWSYSQGGVLVSRIYKVVSVD